MPKMKEYDTRSVARENAFIICFAKVFNDEPIDYLISQSEESIDIKFDSFARKITISCQNNIKEIDMKITENLQNWGFDRMSKITITILRLAIAEILFFDGIPNSVTANEYVELAKKYAPDEDIAFINGVLGSVIKGLK